MFLNHHLLTALEVEILEFESPEVACIQEDATGWTTAMLRVVGHTHLLDFDTDILFLNAPPGKIPVNLNHVISRVRNHCSVDLGIGLSQAK